MARDIKLQATYLIRCIDLHEKIKTTEYAPRVRKVTIRVYRDWRAAIKQFKINFSRIAASN